MVDIFWRFPAGHQQKKKLRKFGFLHFLVQVRDIYKHPVRGTICYIFVLMLIFRMGACSEFVKKSFTVQSSLFVFSEN